MLFRIRSWVGALIWRFPPRFDPVIKMHSWRKDCTGQLEHISWMRCVFVLPWLRRKMQLTFKKRVQNKVAHFYHSSGSGRKTKANSGYSKADHLWLKQELTEISGGWLWNLTRELSPWFQGAWHKQCISASHTDPCYFKGKQMPKEKENIETEKNNCETEMQNPHETKVKWNWKPKRYRT